jgi:hypothetical protein
MYIYICVCVQIYTHSYTYTERLHIIGGPCDSKSATQRSGRQPSCRALQRSDPRGTKEANPLRNLEKMRIFIVSSWGCHHKMVISWDFSPEMGIPWGFRHQ